MQTIDDIRHDKLFFSRFKHSVLLLYQLGGPGPSIVIELSNVRLLSFIKVFNNISQCENYIQTTIDKIFTLIIYSENLQAWLTNKQHLPHNICEIIIFCSTTDNQTYTENWTNRFIQVKEIIMHNEVDRVLLLCGTKYLKKLSTCCQDDQGLLNLLNEDYRKLCLALSNCFLTEANRNDHIISSSVESS